MELAVLLPAAIALAAIAVNALVAFGLCAQFDREAHGFVLTCATSPAYGQDVATSAAEVERLLRGEFTASNVICTVQTEAVAGGHTRFVCQLDYAPTLFGLGLKDSVLGVQLPHIKHATSLVVDVYKPGVLL